MVRSRRSMPDQRRELQWQTSGWARQREARASGARRTRLMVARQPEGSQARRSSSACMRATGSNGVGRRQRAQPWRTGTGWQLAGGGRAARGRNWRGGLLSGARARRGERDGERARGLAGRSLQAAARSTRSAGKPLARGWMSSWTRRGWTRRARKRKRARGGKEEVGGTGGNDRTRRGSTRRGFRSGLGLAALGGLGAGPVERRGQLGLLDWALPLLSFFFKRKEK